MIDTHMIEMRKWNKKCKDCWHYKMCQKKDEKVSLGTTVKDLLHNCPNYVQVEYKVVTLK